ncbi:DUF1707 domain-containing protein [Fodinicola feengrottensis]|uniref:DUF1707 domain-containing protein n=2 Tax=Fodinicola feengrottensis TaxID=435914 RepID=A0ABP4SCC5_9ACTN
MEVMTAPTDRENVRVGTTERESAIAALGEHLSAGRVTLDEYGTRSAEATTAATRGELMALFSDLPAPHPQLDDPAPAAPLAPSVDLAKRAENLPVTTRRGNGDLAKRVFLGVMGVSWLIWIPAVALSHGWAWWLIFVPIGISSFAKKVWGWDDDNDDRDRDQRRRRELRSRRHGW